MKKILLFAIALCYQTIFSQKTELGKVTVEELSEKIHPIDTSAAAAYIFKTGETKFNLNTDGNWTVMTEVKVKIKIYNKKGFENANNQVAYFVGGNASEKVFFYDAVTYNLVDGKIQKSKLKSEGEFTEKVNEDWKIKKIVLPAVKEGSIIEYRYQLISPYITRINDWYFQHSIPVNYVSYSTYIPQYFQYRSVLTGFENIDVKNENLNRNNYNELKTIYTKDNIPAIYEEAYVNNINNYTSILKYELSKIDYPNNYVENLALDWDDVTKQIYDNDSFGKELKFNSYFEDDLVPFLEGVNTRDEKIKAVFKFVKDKMVWNENNGIYCDNGVKKAYKDKTGNVAEINLMLVAMLKHAGIQANPVLLSTKSNGIPVFPNRTAFNYVVAAVEIENDVILLDATSSNTFLNILPSRTHNWVGRLIRDSGSSTDINLMPKKISNDKVMIMANIDPSGTIEGKLREQYFDYIAYFFRENNAKLSEESYIEKLEKRHQGIEIDDYSVANMKDLEKPIVENYSFKHSNLVEIIGDKMYISPMMFFELKENPFKQEKRNFPIDFSIPFNDSYSISLNLPEGYEVEFIPEKINLAMQDDYGFYSFNISSSLKTIQISSTFSINASIVPAQHYMMLKDFYKLMIEKQSEKIVLRKMK
ncbi:DUF3857 domain-containing protein [Flavobacterium sp.]|uniref:DUF3857 domain-containing protein n=1 Tax=Flavobacterium sp. TaxID=239 RepID=UPI003F6A2EA7